MKLKTIDDVCGLPPGSFKLFLLEQKQELAKIERDRKRRIKARQKKI